MFYFLQINDDVVVNVSDIEKFEAHNNVLTLTMASGGIIPIEFRDNIIAKSKLNNILDIDKFTDEYNAIVLKLTEVKGIKTVI